MRSRAPNGFGVSRSPFETGSRTADTCIRSQVPTSRGAAPLPRAGAGEGVLLRGIGRQPVH